MSATIKTVPPSPKRADAVRRVRVGLQRLLALGEGVDAWRLHTALAGLAAVLEMHNANDHVEWMDEADATKVAS